MKKILSCFIVIALLGTSCNKDEADDIPTPSVIQEITIENARLLCNTDLAWLKEIIKKADEDKATNKYGGQYMGQIWLYNYHSDPVFLVQMMMGSGAYAGYPYYCSGSAVSFTGIDPQIWFKDARTKGKLVYKNAPL